MKHSTEFIADNAKAAKAGITELINLLYNLHYEQFPNSNDSDFIEVSFAVFAADRASKMGIPHSAAMPPDWTYSPKEGQSDNPNLSERAAELIAAVRARMAPERPYADIIQEIELPNIESALLFLGRQYCWFSNTLALREVWLGLQERINEYALADNVANKHLMRPRLQHAIAWLQAYENQLATYLASNQADELSTSTQQALPAARQSIPSSAKYDTDILIDVLTEQRATRPFIPTTVGILLQDDAGHIREFAPDHAERLLAYPGSLWVKAPEGAIPTPLPPAESKKELCYCQTHPNARTLDELPADCRIHETIRKHLPEIEEQIAARKLADTSAGFRSYCESELARHVKNVGDLTKNLAHPTMYSEQGRPQMLEIKFWNLALCSLYKQELEPSTLQHSSQQNSHIFTDAASGNTAAADVRRYFPAVATIHGSTATDANALQQLAVWLLHWAERHGHRPTSDEYSLAGRLREQQAAHANAGKFLKACYRLYEALLPLAADEHRVKRLLGNEYSPHSHNNLAAVLKWWAGWIKEQQSAHYDPAGAYLTALRRVPIVEVWENDRPRYTIPAHLCDLEGFEAETAMLRQAFETALPDLPTKKKKALRHALSELLGIDWAGVKRRREQFERGEYGLDFLPADYPTLRFDVAGQPGGFKWQWVDPLFWGGLGALLQYKQAAARAACKQLSAALPEVPAGSPNNPPTLVAPAPIATDSSVRNYFHLTPEAIARRYKLSGETRDAAYRQSLASQIGKRLRGEKQAHFLEQRTKHNNIHALKEWLETQLFYLEQELSPEEKRQLQTDINEEAASIALLLPYSDTYGTYFITKLKAESLLSVSEFLQFTREPWYAGLAGFYLLDKADDVAYFRDIITEHLSRNPEDSSPVIHRAIEWLTSEIDRLSVPGVGAFRPSFYVQDSSSDKSGVASTVSTLFDKLCGGFKREHLEKALGHEGLGLYDLVEGKQTDTATSTHWALLYWGLQHKGFLPAGLSAGKAAELLKITFGASISKTRINDNRPASGVKPTGYLARVIELLSDL